MKLVPLNKETRGSLIWWQHLDNMSRGTPLGQVQIDHYLYPDISLKGWGAHVLDQSALDIWSDALAQLHINVLELRAIWLGLQSFKDLLDGSTVAIMCDTMSAIAYVKNQGV